MAAYSEAHQIRLAGPWQTSNSAGTDQRIKLPFVSTEDEKQLEARRTFQGSEGILAAKRIHVRVAFQGMEPNVQLNGKPLTPKRESSQTGCLEFDATGLLQKSNLLILHCLKQPDDTVTDVCLLIFEQ
ncbi:MAG: hypothetical protein ABJZ55_20055 [Fuerstiella sp.]